MSVAASRALRILRWFRVVPFVLSTVAYCIGKYDSNNDNCKLKEYEWHTISNYDSFEFPVNLMPESDNLRMEVTINS